MTRSKQSLFLAVGLVALAVVLVAGVVLGASLLRKQRSVNLSAGDPIRVAAAVSPRTPLFADTVTARIEIAADTHRVEPGSVRIASRFVPFRVVAAPVLERRTAPGAEFLSWSVTVSCVEDACRPRRIAKRVTFAPATVTYSPRGGDADSSSVKVTWPPVLFYSRVDPDEIRALNPLSQPPWRAELASLPAVSYRASPTLVAVLFYAAGGILLACGLVLLVPLTLRKMGAMPESRARVLGPVEQALELLETMPDGEGAVEQRREALELVATELDRRGERDLELSARRLAWSVEPPELEDTSALAQSVRHVVAAGDVVSERGREGDDGTDDGGMNAAAPVDAGAADAVAGPPGPGSNGRDG